VPTVRDKFRHVKTDTDRDGKIQAYADTKKNRYIQVKSGKTAMGQVQTCTDRYTRTDR
jgi:hypothetical protein